MGSRQKFKIMNHSTTTIVSTTVSSAANATALGPAQIIVVELTLLDYVFWALAGFYFLLVVFPFVQLVRLRTHSQLPIMRWTTQKLFLTLLLIVDTGRFLFFFITPWLVDGSFEVDDLHSPWLWILDDFCELVFFTTFNALVLFWAEIIHHAKHHARSRHMRPLFVFANAVVYVLDAVLLVFVVLANRELKVARTSHEAKSLVQRLADYRNVDHYFFISLSLLSALAFLVYGL